MGAREGPARRGGDLAILCVLGMCRPQRYVFQSFCLGRVLFSAQQSGMGTFFTVSVWARVLFSGPTVWQGLCFDPGLIPKFRQRAAKAKGCNFTFVLSGKSGKFLSGKGKGMPPWAAHLYP